VKKKSERLLQRLFFVKNLRGSPGEYVNQLESDEKRVNTIVGANQLLG